MGRSKPPQDSPSSTAAAATAAAAAAATAAAASAAAATATTSSAVDSRAADPRASLSVRTLTRISSGSSTRSSSGGGGINYISASSGVNRISDHRAVGGDSNIISGDGRGLHSFPCPLNLSTPCPFPLSLSSFIPPISLK